MAPISPAAFARSLRGLSDAELAAFVAELWAARGWDAAVEGGAVVARDGGRSERIWIRPGGRFAGLLPGWVPRPGFPAPTGPGREPPDTDVVVTRSLGGTAGDGSRVMDAAELREMALYAVDPVTRADLFDRHLGRPPAVDARPAGSRVRSVPVVAAAALLVVAAVLGAVAYDLHGPGGPSAPGAAIPPAESTVQPSGTSATPAGTPPAGAVASGTTGDGEYPPGIRPDGVRFVNAVVVSHLLALSTRSHRWVIEYREVVDGELRGYVRETVWMENDTSYRSSVERGGTVQATPRVISDVSTYADGEVRYGRIEEDGTTRYRRHVLWPWGDPGAEDLPPFTQNPIRVIEWYLSVEESRLVGATERNGTRYFRLAGEGDSWPYTTDVRVTATVDEHGVVRQLRRTHQPPDAEARVVVTFRVTDVGNTSVTPPPWLEEARRATESGSGTAADP